MRYQATELDNGKWGVIDLQGFGLQLVAAGMTKQQAEAYAERHNLRHAWGT